MTGGLSGFLFSFLQAGFSKIEKKEEQDVYDCTQVFFATLKEGIILLNKIWMCPYVCLLKSPFLQY